MTREAFSTALSEVADTYYVYAPIGTKTPYIVYSWNNTPNIAADDTVYQDVAAVDVQCYFTDVDMINTLDGTLKDLVGFYVSSVFYDATEKLYIKTYTMEVIEDAES